MKKKIYITSFILFLIDLLTKIVILSLNNYPYTIIKNFFSINMVTNTGAAFSSFSGHQLILIIIAILVLIFINKSIIEDIKTKLGIIGISLLIGGILGNLFDRIIYNKVIDFLSFNILGYMFPIFNIADIFICVGVLILITDYVRGDKNETTSRKK